MGVRRGTGVSRIATMHTIAFGSTMGILLFAQNIWSQEVSRRNIEAEYQGCLDDLSLVDNGDLELTSGEYVPFIALRSGGQLEYADYQDMPVSLIASFNFGACFCALISSDDQCCVGDKANINLDVETSQLITDNIYTFCSTVDMTINSLLPDTASPTMAPQTAIPTGAPTAEPTIVLATPTPTTTPTSSTTTVPSGAPTRMPTAPSLRPTSQNELCVTFQYGIVNNAGFDAEQIMNMTNNTLKTGLILATENVTIETLNASFPEGRLLRYRKRPASPLASARSDPGFGPLLPAHGLIVPLDFFGSHIPQGIISKAPDLGNEGDGRKLAYLPQSLHLSASLSNLSRKLVFYTDGVPPEVNSIIDNPFCPSPTPDMTKCQIVTSTVCVFLEEGDDPVVVRETLLGGIQASIQSGAFEEAIPEEHRLL